MLLSRRLGYGWIWGSILAYVMLLSIYTLVFISGEGCIIEPITGLCTRPHPLVLASITLPLLIVGEYLLWREGRYAEEDNGRREGRKGSWK